jgi:hypothetical protein
MRARGEWISGDSNPDLTVCRTVAFAEVKLLTRKARKVGLGRRIRTSATSSQDSDATRLHHTQLEKFVVGQERFELSPSELKVRRSSS